MPSYIKALQVSGILFALLLSYGIVCYFGKYEINDPIMQPMMWISKPFISTLADMGLVTEGFQWERGPSIFGWALICAIISAILFAISASILYIRDMDKDPLS